MIGFTFSVPYHMLRAATAAGVRVHVLGGVYSRRLRKSRFCASYRQSAAAGTGEHHQQVILDEICQEIRRGGIEVVFPSDHISTRLLAAVRDRVPVPTMRMPDLATFDLLYDKWNFTRFSLDHGVRVPRGWLYAGAGEVRRDLLSGSLSFPVTLKPTNLSGGIGVVHIVTEKDIGRLEDIDYQPVLAQQHIIGETVTISVWCRSGRVLAHATERHDNERFGFFANPDLLDNVQRLAAVTRLNGPAHLDAVLEKETGLSYLVECNPYSSDTIYLSKIPGLNFLDFAFGPGESNISKAATPASGEIRLSLWAILRHPLRSTSQEWRLLAYRYSDPLPHLLMRVGAFDSGGMALVLARDVSPGRDEDQYSPRARRPGWSCGGNQRWTQKP